MDAGDTTYGVNVVDALADGAFRVSIVSVWGDFYIDQSELRINYTPVPEPTTTLLLGLGLVGLAGVRRKKSREVADGRVTEESLCESLTRP